MKLISSKFTSLVSLEQSQLKPIGRYGGGLLRFSYLPIDISWDCSNDTRFVSLVEMSFRDHRGGLKHNFLHFSSSTLEHKSNHMLFYNSFKSFDFSWLSVVDI